LVDDFGDVDWTGTVYPAHATELARQAAANGYELIIAVGGDGTSLEVINGLMQIPPEKRPHLGVIPLGSGNDFSYGLGMDSDPAAALRQIFQGKPHPIDIGKITDNRGVARYWGNVVGIGFDAKATINSRRFTYLRGYLIYLMAVLQTIILDHDAPRLQVKTDREEWEDETIMLVICNGKREGGGFLVAPDARTDDQIYDYATIGKVSRLRMLRLLPEVMRGTHGRFADVRMGRLSNLRIESDRPLIIHTDGEIFSSSADGVTNIAIVLEPGALQIIS
jgi:diacylglycerol kinase (ATP)